jgi:ribosomal protein S12 methylthiotransferase accessory factor
MGCHPDPRVALLRALTEAAQCRLTWIAGARDDARPEDYDASPEALAWEREMLAVRGRGRPFPDTAGFAGRVLEDDLSWLLDRLEAAGVPDPVWVDLSQPAVGIPVVHVVVAGLEPRGFGDALDDYRPGPRARARRRRRR